MNHRNFKRRVRYIQDATGAAYTTCLRLARGELVLEPKAESCVIAAAMQVAYDGAPPAAPANAARQPCRCSECAR